MNFFGRVQLFWATLPALKESRGTFVDVNSALAYRGIPLQGAYCATKAAMRTFLETARTELAKHESGVDVCCVLPGAINTPQFDRARQKLGFQPEPVPPIYEPEPFAEAVLPARSIRSASCRSGGARSSCSGPEGFPRLGDRILLRTGWDGQHTGDPKPVSAPDNLFATIPSDLALVVGSAIARWLHGVDSSSAGASLAPDGARAAGPCRARSGGCALASWRCAWASARSDAPDPLESVSRTRAKSPFAARLADGRCGRRATRINRKRKMALLELKNLHVALEDGTEIVKGVDLAVDTNEVHAIMGPNGSGKSTLAYTLMGHPGYQVTEGDILFDGESILEAGPDERAQKESSSRSSTRRSSPASLTNFLRQAINAARRAQQRRRRPGADPRVPQGALRADGAPRVSRACVRATSTTGSPAARRSGSRSCRWPCSSRGSRCSTRPTRARHRRAQDRRERRAGARQPGMGALVITHYQRILNYITPDHVHVFVGGKIVASGGSALAHKLEAEVQEAFMPATVGGEA